MGFSKIMAFGISACTQSEEVRLFVLKSLSSNDGTCPRGYICPCPCSGPSPLIPLALPPQGQEDAVGCGLG